MKKIFLLTFLILFSCNQNIKSEKNITTNNTKNDLISGKEQISNEILSSFTKKTLKEQISFNCEEIHPFYEGIIQKEIEIRNNFIKSCNELKQKAKEKYDTKVGFLKLEDCKKIISDFNKRNNIINENSDYQVKVCEMKLGIERGCEIFTDINKKSECEELQNFKKNINEIKNTKNLNLEEYL